MSNASTLFQLEAQSAYERDGLQNAVRFLKSTIAPVFPADNLTVFRTSTSAKSDIVTNAAQRVVLVHVASPATATTDSWLQLFNTSSASVTLGGLPQPIETIKVPYAKSKTVVYYPSTDLCQFTAALSIAVTSSNCGGTAADATNAPAITILYGT